MPQHLVELFKSARRALEQSSADQGSEDFSRRLGRHGAALTEGLANLYGDRDDFSELVAELAAIMVRYHHQRSAELRELDLERELQPDWFQCSDQVGYVFYVDKFAGRLSNVADHLDYLSELGVTYLHLMPLFEWRPGESDGGYAISDYRRVHPELGTLSELESLAQDCRSRGMSICLDLVLNHVAKEHQWARAAQGGHPEYRDYFHVFARRESVDAYERTLPDIFPNNAPGNFTHDEELKGWVWTTFHDYQWDLNWANPKVFLEFADLILFLANRGIEVFRLDAVAFLWKRLGTDCQNQPEVHDIVQALRAVARIAAPAVLFKAEAIVGPDHLMKYLGQGRHRGKVADLAYQNSLMANMWGALAARDARLLTRALSRLGDKPLGTAWVTYVRCHDDIGWAIADEDAEAFGFSGPGHRHFLADFYRGSFPGSPARGLDFQADSSTGDRRTCGTTASLAGLQLGRESGNQELIDGAIERTLLLYAIIFFFDGIPLIYMGDEIGLHNDPQYQSASDTRWVHRPAMDWTAAELRNHAGTVESRLFKGLEQIANARRASSILHAEATLRCLESQHRSVLALERERAGHKFLALFNVSEHPQRHPAPAAELRDEITGRIVRSDHSGHIELAPYARLWLSGF